MQQTCFRLALSTDSLTDTCHQVRECARDLLCVNKAYS